MIVKLFPTMNGKWKYNWEIDEGTIVYFDHSHDFPLGKVKKVYKNKNILMESIQLKLNYVFLVEVFKLYYTPIGIGDLEDLKEPIKAKSLVIDRIEEL